MDRINESGIKENIDSTSRKSVFRNTLFSRLLNVKRVFAFSGLLILCLLICGCGKKNYGTDFSTKPLQDAGYSIEEITVEIPGLTQEYNLLLVADLHILYNNEEVYSEDKATVAARLNEFSPDGGKTTSAKLWEKMPELLDLCNSDYILFAGDMIDFNSVANTEALRDGFAKLKTPYCYVKSDHDVVPFYMNIPTGECNEAAIERQSDIYVNSGAWYIDIGEVVILGYNRSDKVITDEGINVVREAVSIGKPIIMVSHVPFNSLVDSSLDELCRERFGGKNLTWEKHGDTQYTFMDPVGCDFINLVRDQSSGIKEVVCGHLHYSWDGEISEGVRQHVFLPAFTKSVGYIRIRGAE